MLTTTIQIVRSALQADPSISVKERTQALAWLRGKPKIEIPNPAQAPPQLIRRAEAARRLGYSLRLIDRLAQQGVLTKRKLPNRKRASGFLASDVDALIEGKENQ
jgi:hypothetical protein